MSENHRVDTYEAEVDRLEKRTELLKVRAGNLWHEMNAGERSEEWGDNYDKFEDDYLDNHYRE